MILSYFRTLVLYLALVAVIRVMGKRQVGEMAPSEFVVTMLVANLAAIPMQDGAIPLYSGLTPILTVLGAELVLSWLTLGSSRLRRLLSGKPLILIENGRLLQGNLRAARMTLDELTAHLRLKDVLDLKTVQYAILETNGSLSVFLYPKDAPASARDAGIQASEQRLPISVVSDGKLCREDLARAKKDRTWLDRVLAERQAGLEETMLLSVDSSDKIVFIRKEEAK